MNPTDLQRYKRLLLSRLDEFIQQAPGGWPRWLPERAICKGISSIKRTPTPKQTVIRLHQSESHLLRAIEDALARIGHDQFGVCETCGSPISKARLEAVP